MRCGRPTALTASVASGRATRSTSSAPSRRQTRPHPRPHLHPHLRPHLRPVTPPQRQSKQWVDLSPPSPAPPAPLHSASSPLSRTSGCRTCCRPSCRRRAAGRPLLARSKRLRGMSDASPSYADTPLASPREGRRAGGVDGLSPESEVARRLGSKTSACFHPRPQRQDDTDVGVQQRLNRERLWRAACSGSR